MRERVAFRLGLISRESFDVGRKKGIKQVRTRVSKRARHVNKADEAADALLCAPAKLGRSQPGTLPCDFACQWSDCI